MNCDNRDKGAEFTMLRLDCIAKKYELWPMWLHPFLRRIWKWISEYAIEKVCDNQHTF